MYGLAASVFTERVTLAVETAKYIKAGTVWINCHNMFDAAAGFGGYKQSGYGRDGGREGLYEYIKPKWQRKLRSLTMNKFAKMYKLLYKFSRYFCVIYEHILFFLLIVFKYTAAQQKKYSLCDIKCDIRL